MARSSPFGPREGSEPDESAQAPPLALVRSREVKRSVVDAVKQIGECNTDYGHRDVDDLRIGEPGLFDRRYYIGLNRAARCHQMQHESGQRVITCVARRPGLAQRQNGFTVETYLFAHQCVCGQAIFTAGCLADDQFGDFDIPRAQAALFERRLKTQYRLQRDRTITADSDI